MKLTLNRLRRIIKEEFAKNHLHESRRSRQVLNGNSSQRKSNPESGFVLERWHKLANMHDNLLLEGLFDEIDQELSGVKRKKDLMAVIEREFNNLVKNEKIIALVRNRAAKYRNVNEDDITEMIIQFVQENLIRHLVEMSKDPEAGFDKEMIKNFLGVSDEDFDTENGKQKIITKTRELTSDLRDAVKKAAKAAREQKEKEERERVGRERDEAVRRNLGNPQASYWDDLR